MTILVVGGAGYIGSHICKAIKNRGLTPVTFDNLSHGHEWAVRYGPLFRGDLHQSNDLNTVFEKYCPQAVIHLASYIHVRESVENPYKYYHNNVSGTLNLLHAMQRHEVNRLVFSSTAAIYGNPQYLPIDESHLAFPLNPYGRSKWIVEELLEDFSSAHHLKFVTLRYFNAAGADPDGELGEAHSPETHLIPLVIQTALGMHPLLTINGIDHPTADGTAIRDYIHVSDLAEAHLLALDYLNGNHPSIALNLGTGRGYSIREVIQAVQRQSGQTIPTQIAPRYLADPPALIANPTKAEKLLHWRPQYSSLEAIIESAWNWHSSLLLKSK